MNKYSKSMRRVLAYVLTFAMVVSVLTVSPSNEAQAAAKKVVKSLSVSSKATIYTGANKTVSAKVTTSKKVAAKDLKVTVKSSNNSVATAKITSNPTKKAKSGTSEIKITAKKAGTAYISVTTVSTDKKNKKVTKKIKVTVKDVAVTAVKGSINRTALVVGQTAKITAAVYPSNATNKKITYQSAKPGVATVSSTGVIVAKGVGTTYIYAKSANGKYKRFTVTVSRPAVAGLTVTPASKTLKIGESVTIKSTVTPSGAVQGVTYTTSDDSVATVSAAGVITAVAPGTADITVKTLGKNGKNEAISKVVTITVSKIAVESVQFDQTEYVIEKGKSQTAMVTVLPANASDKSVSFSSSNTQVATVTDAGVIFGVGAGTATITATSGNGVSATAKVTVEEPVVITLSNTELSLAKNQSVNIYASIADVVWSSDNIAVATVDQDGKVTGIAPGEANIIATSGKASASCKVTVSKYDPENDGVTLSVVNPIKNNADDNGNVEIIENTCLVNQDMVIQAYVQKDATPKKDARVKLILDEIDSNIVSKYDFVIKVNGVATDTAVTNADGFAEFTVSYMGDIESTYDVKTDCPYISFNASTTVDNQPNDEDIIVKFASVLRKGIQVDNNHVTGYDKIIPFTNHAAGDNGIQNSWNTNLYYNNEYVTSQQVGNVVYLSATPEFILPPERTASEAKFEVVFPSKEVTTGQEDVSVVGPGQTETYSIYNDGADVTTTTSIINVPEGLVSMSVFFNKISISKYSQLYIDLYEYDGAIGKHIFEKTYTDFVQEYEKEDGVQIKNLSDMTKKGILIISIQSPGQVDVSTTGYSINKVTGDFNSESKNKEQEIPVVNSVKWSDVTTDARYEVAEPLEYKDVSNPTTGYLAEYVGVENSYVIDDTNCTFSYRVPTFNSKAETANAICGNALITATYKMVDGTVKTATYAYPAVADKYYDSVKGEWVATNTNKLMDKAPDIKAIFLGYDVIDKDGNIQQTTGGMTQNGNQAIIKSSDNNKSGAIFVEARLQIDALNKEIATCDKTFNYDKSPVKGANNKYPLYSYVQFVAKPEAEEGDGEVPMFHAIEDQYIVVTGQVIASNGEVQPDQPIKFYVGSKELTSAAVGKTIGNNVVVKYMDEKTNKEGKAFLVLVGHEGSYVKNLTVKYEGEFEVFNTYAGDQQFEAIKQGDKTKNICDLCWLDLGLSYEEDVCTPSWKYSYESGSTVNTNSESVVDKTWKVGFLPVVKCPLGSFNTNLADLQYANRTNIKSDYSRLFKGVTNVGVKYTCDGVNFEKCNEMTATTTDSSALITSTKTGDTMVNGEVFLKGDTCRISYYDNDGELQYFDTVGVNSYEVNATKFTENLDFGGKILYTMNWQPGNWIGEFVHPYGNRVYKEQDTVVYFKLQDKFGNPIKDKAVKVSATFDGTTYPTSNYTADANTNSDGIVKIDVKKPSKTGELIFKLEVDVLKKVSIPVNYVGLPTGVTALQVKSDPAFDKDNTKKITLTFNNQIDSKYLTDTVLKKLFVIKDKDGKLLEIENVTVNLTTVVITLKDNTFIENENYTLEIKTDDSAKVDGIVYVLYDVNGQAIKAANATKAFTVKY